MTNPPVQSLWTKHRGKKKKRLEVVAIKMRVNQVNQVQERVGVAATPTYVCCQVCIWGFGGLGLPAAVSSTTNMLYCYSFTCRHG